MNIHGHLFDISKTMPCIATTVILIADLCFVNASNKWNVKTASDLHSENESANYVIGF